MNNLVDGKALAEKITAEVKEMVAELESQPTLTVITCDPNFETKKFLNLKQKKAESLGILMNTVVLPFEIETSEVVEMVKLQSEKVDGVVVQLPLPAHIDAAEVLSNIPSNKDIDVFGYDGLDNEVLPPVVGAIDEIIKAYEISLLGKKVVVFGAGRLVGGPAILYMKTHGALVEVVTETSTDTEIKTKDADIIILGVGKPNLLTADMVKDGVVVFDAGSSEDGGLLVGDADRELASKASLLTPVPGGIGPLTVILLFRNLLKLRSRQ